MLRSPSRALALLPLALALGCQDYNFNPVGHCLIQPGSERITLANLSTADVLFVVDDSGSMGGEQAKLATNFKTFINNLDATNAARASKGLEPIDFHIAITTTSVFYNAGGPLNAQGQPTRTCNASCLGMNGALACCDPPSSTGTLAPPITEAKACPAGSGCGTGYGCTTSCPGYEGAPYCCGPSGVEKEIVTCTTAGDPCGALNPRFDFPMGARSCANGGACSAGYACSTTCPNSGGAAYCCSSSGYELALLCDPGVAANQTLYPHGSFVGAGSNPRVLHFDKELYGPAQKNKQGFTSQQLMDWFAGGNGATGNVIVGTCGSGQEQGLQAGRLAVEKAVAGQQLDTYDPSGKAVRSTAQWLHSNSKLVVVFVGDEDDCSSPEDPVLGVALSGSPGSDTCVNDPAKREFQVQQIVDYLASLGRPLGAAFIVSTAQTSCQDDLCTAGTCCATDCPGSLNVCTRTDTCGGQAAGSRFLTAAAAFKQKGADVVVGSICDPDFGTLLGRIADIVKPPSTLLLPTQPAEDKLALLRITDGSGTTVKTCTGPAPAGTSGTALAAYDWWFTTSQQSVDPSTASTFIYINHATNNCEANPGQTYSADYLGRLPATGCTPPAAGDTTVGSPECAAALGGKTTDWNCYAPPGATVGTCLCGSGQ